MEVIIIVILVIVVLVICVVPSVIMYRDKRDFGIGGVVQEPEKKNKSKKASSIPRPTRLQLLSQRKTNLTEQYSSKKPSSIPKPTEIKRSRR